MGQAFQKKARANLFSRGPEKKNYKVHVLLRIKGAFCFLKFGFYIEENGKFNLKRKTTEPKHVS